MSTPYTIRPVKEEDLEAVRILLQAAYKLHAEAHPDTYHEKTPTMISRGELITIMEDEDQAILVAESDGKTVGMIHLMVESGEESELEAAYSQVSIEDISVDPAYQRQGIASALIHAASEWTHDREIETLTTITYDFNTPALSLFEGQGFKTKSIRLNKKV